MSNMWGTQISLEHALTQLYRVQNCFIVLYFMFSALGTAQTRLGHGS